MCIMEKTDIGLKSTDSSEVLVLASLLSGFVKLGEELHISLATLLSSFLKW